MGRNYLKGATATASMRCSPPPATTSASSCTSWKGFNAPSSGRSSPRRREPKSPKSSRSSVLHGRLITNLSPVRGNRCWSSPSGTVLDNVLQRGLAAFSNISPSPLLEGAFIFVPRGTECSSLRLVSCLIRCSLIRAECVDARGLRELAQLPVLHPPGALPASCAECGLFAHPPSRVALAAACQTRDQGRRCRPQPQPSHPRTPLARQGAKALDRAHRKRSGEPYDLAILGGVPFRISALPWLPLLFPGFQFSGRWRTAAIARPPAQPGIGIPSCRMV